jgi:Glycosyl hydrolase family 26
VPAAIQSFEDWLGSPVTVQMSGTGIHPDWGTIEGADWVLGPVSTWLKAKPGRQINYQLSMMPEGLGITLAQIARGDHDARYRTAANRLAQYGMLGVEIRPGHEMDGGWYPWKAHPGSGLEADFAAAWRRIVTVMRQAQPTNKWVWVFNPTDHQWTDRAYLERLWPGDAYVDQIGIDCYDQTFGGGGLNEQYYQNGATRLAAQQKVWSVREARLNILRDMAQAHGKPLQFPEWGLVTWKTAFVGAGGDDNPYFIQKMYEFFTNPANNVTMHAYADYGPDPMHIISPPNTIFPQASAKYKQLFGAGASQ